MRKPDFAEKYTDKDFAEYEKRIRKVYEQAEKEIGEKLADFTERHKARDIKMRELVEAGKMTEADYKSWMQGQVFQGKQWRAKQQQMAETLYNANTIAQRMANGNLPKVFAMNANYMSYTAEKAAGYRIGFTMYDSATVANLIKNNPKILPFKKLNKEKDIRWNFKNIKGEVTQGIIQGESVNEIAARLQKEMPNRSYKMCRVHARTMYTSAQNAGRMESMKMHQQMGIKNKKQWMATLDERTRWMHRDLDGQVRDLEEPFEIGQYSIMYPGDPFAHPSMTYNCRCSMVEVVDKYPDKYERRDNITKEVIQNMTYNEWAEMNGISNPRPNGMKPVMPKKQKEQVSATDALIGRAKVYAAALLSTLPTAEAAEFEKMLDEGDEDMRELYSRYTPECRKIFRSADGGAYNPGFDSVEYSFSNYDGQSKYSTMAHEMGHMFDNHIKKNDAFTFKEMDLINERCMFGSGMYKVMRERTSSSDQFLAAMRADRDNLRDMLNDETFLNDVRRSNGSAGLQDALDGLFGTRGKNHIRGLNWGHGDAYYHRFYNDKIKGFGKEKELKSVYKELGFDASNQDKVKRISRDYDTASELWANVSSATMCGGTEKEYFDKYMPNTMATFKEMIRKVNGRG